MNKKPILYADDDTESILELIKIRFPSLIVGLFLGIIISLLISKFEQLISANVQLAFFLPFIVYLSDAVGTQTQTIYTRELRMGKATFSIYLIKELLLGIIIGLFSALISGSIVQLWLGDELLTISIALSVFAATATAPLIAVLVTRVMSALRTDPAAGSGPIDTVIQDMVSVLIFFFICNAIL